MQDDPRNSWLAILALSFVGAFVVAVVYVVVFTWTLPPSDGAYGAAPFEDSLMLPIMSLAAGLAGLVTFPFAYWNLRRANLLRSFVFALLVTLVVTIVVTAASASWLGFGPLGLLGAFAAMFYSIVSCKERYPLQPRVQGGGTSSS